MNFEPFSQVRILDCQALADPALFRHWFNRMDPIRQQKILASRTESERITSLGSGILVRRLLEENGLEPDSLFYAKDGAPRFVHPLRYISISHGGTYAMTGLSAVPIGVDVEVFSQEILSIAAHFFTEEEQTILRQSDVPLDCAARIWSRKECMIKRDGFRELRTLSTAAPQRLGMFQDISLPGHSCVVYLPPMVDADIQILDPQILFES